MNYRQSEAIHRNIWKLISRPSVLSMLDVGAGFVASAAELAKKVRHYVAVEKDSYRARSLRQAGLNVIEGCFPLKWSAHLT